MKEDTLKAKLLIKIGRNYYAVGNTEAAKEYYQKAFQLSEKLPYIKGMMAANSLFTDILNFQGLFDSALILRKNMLEYAKQVKDNEQMVAFCYGNIGICYDNKEYFDLALDYYLKELSYLENINDTISIGATYDLIQLVYQHSGRMDKAIQYGEKAATLLKNHGRYTRVISTLAENYLMDFPPQYEKAEKLLKESLDSLAIYPDADIEAYSLALLGQLYRKTEQWKAADTFLQKALTLYTKMQYTYGLCNVYRNLGLLAFARQQFSEAENWTQQAFSTAQKVGVKEDMIYCMNTFADLAIVRHDFEKMKYWKEQADSLQKVFVNDKLLRTMEELSIKYETEKKEIQIFTMQRERKWMLWLSVAILIVLLLMCVALLLRHRMLRNKKLLAEQKINQLEQEKQLLATQAMLDGETIERNRLARDLHDSLGGMLSVVKLNLTNINQGAFIEQEDIQIFNNVLTVLDNAILELRRIAHHLMPKSLVVNGLKTALQDFCSVVPNAEFHYYGEEKRLEQKIEIVIYRSIHELVNNALKHAKAQRIIVQLIQEPNRVAFTVQDDGRGFDVSRSQGMGLRNLQDRIAAYNGHLDINSRLNEGTEVSVEFKI
jgi:signal transduction histidine kinase